MKHSALVKFILFTIVLSIGAVGCSRGPKSLTPIPGQGNTTTIDGPGGGRPIIDDRDLGTEDIPPAGRPDLATANQDPNFFSANTVYFAFDSSEVGPDALADIQAVANHLNSNLSHGVIVEGHCDDRGTEEYNRALGERRALAIREVMVNQYGVDPEAVHTISYGEDIPAVDGQNEDAWSQNRRGEFILLTW